MEDEKGGIYVLEGSISSIGEKRKRNDNYEGQRMGGSWPKGIGNNTVVNGFISGV